ncbi:uncharacterized protein [Haliotis cracherodii]
MVSLEVVWNCRHLQSPSQHLQRVAASQCITANVDRTVDVLSSAVDIMKDLEFLASELFVLSRFLIKRRNQMRRHKTLQTLTQVEGCLKRYQETDFVGLVCKMHQHFKQARLGQQTGKVVELPTHAMLEYFLVRVMGTTAILVQTVNYCTTAAAALQTDINLAHLLPQSTMCLATISRIWVCCRSLYLDCLSWYSSLFPILTLLPRGEVWLLQTTPLPEDLTFWLGKRLCLDNMAVNPPSTGDRQSDSLVLLPSLGEDEDEESAETSTNCLKRSLVVEEDIGAPVSVSRVQKISDTGQRISDTGPPKKKKKGSQLCSETDVSSMFNSSPTVSDPSSLTPTSAVHVPIINRETSQRDEPTVEHVPIIKRELSSSLSGSQWPSQRQWSSVQELKRVVHQSNSCETVLNIFKEFEPKDSIDAMTVWDEYPQFSYSQKCQLFRNKLDTIKKCCCKADDEGVPGSVQDKWLADAKSQCLTYLKGLNASNKHNVSVMMTLEGLQEMTGELATGHLSLGEKTWMLNPHDARVLKMKLESCWRKMQKVKHPAKWKPLQDKARDRVMSYIKRSVAYQDVKTGATDGDGSDSVDYSGPPMPTRQKWKQIVLPAQRASSTSDRDNDERSDIKDTGLLAEADNSNACVAQKKSKRKKKKRNVNE